MFSMLTFMFLSQLNITQVSGPNKCLTSITKKMVGINTNYVLGHYKGKINGGTYLRHTCRNSVTVHVISKKNTTTAPTLQKAEKQTLIH
jgi:hypothetical protein